MYLNCHSFHSLRYGTIPLGDLVQEAVTCKVRAMALTDINTVTGIYDFYKACIEADIKPLVGIEFRQDNKLLYIGLAQNRAGIGEMCRFLTQHNFDNIPMPDTAPEFENVAVIYPVENAPIAMKEKEYVGIRPEQVTILYNKEWKDRISKAVVLHPVTYRTKKEYNLHKILRAIDTNIILSKLTEDNYCKASETMQPISEVEAFYSEYPQIIRNTEKLIDGCNFEYDFSTPKNKKNYTESKESDKALLAKLAKEGLLKRYGADHIEAATRLYRELKVIDELNFSAYFLITWDIVQYSFSRGLMHIGRGSGANSIVAYCLGITDICPLELDLYFERFLNLNRKSPPDFDIDWSWQDRDTILEYIFERFGREHVAFCGTIAEFKYRSIFREVGKVFGLPKEELDALATKPIHTHDTNKIVRLVHEYGIMLEKYPNMRSMHSCGILISEEPITNYSALEMPPKGFPIVQFDMHIAEDIGLDKFDILSQRGIGHINDAAALVKKNRGVTVDIRDTSISKNEVTANEYLSRGNTIGCFYIESPAMRGLLRRLKCNDYKTLVAASSIIRPGVAQSGMMKEYIFRHNHPDKFEYFHEVFEEQLGETYGIMVYQEDVIKIALGFGGLDPADGDILRRAMSGKGRSKAALQKVKDKFFACCAEKGHPVQLSQEVYRQIESFAGYSFCKAHSASYAVESYQSLYLKVYYPLEFMVAVINNQGGFYRTEVYVHEAKMSGGIIHNPCVNKSGFQSTLYGKDIYLGFMHLQGLEAKIANLISEEREHNGEYRSLEDFIKRIQIGIEGVQTLIFIGAFNFTGMNKNELLVRARLLMVNFKPENRMPSLLDTPVKEYKLPTLARSEFEDAFDEIELLSFPVSCSPFDLLQTKYRGGVRAKDLTSYHKQTVKMLAYLVSRKHVPTKRGEMFFGTWIDLDGNYFDTAHFSDCLKQYPFQGGGCYLLLGTVEVDYHFPTITIQKMAKMPFIPDPRYSHSDKRFDAQKNIREDVSMTHRAPYPQEHEIGLPRYKMAYK
ncbi:MAG: DNA polymerase III subunit alpha [Flavobacterium lindanitolerans]|uniref:DNA polymerase III subunit alpha n=1 Tax=Flavobacterium lindanitolerans TaxID=428988 RepID=UPI001A567D6A|nr:DNA polymerase III subunit alpha [Flavobacterium lindanitolerans]MBL7867374.1 DNA polymerase III subunit alpha [Flavobacterium lindanitolerans]